MKRREIKSRRKTENKINTFDRKTTLRQIIRTAQTIATRHNGGKNEPAGKVKPLMLILRTSRQAINCRLPFHIKRRVKRK